MPSHSIAFAILFATVIYLLDQIRDLEDELRQVERNAAIAVLSAERAHTKIGAFAPCFSESPEAFVNAEVENSNLPLPVFSDGVLQSVQRDMLSSSRWDDEQKADMLRWWQSLARVPRPTVPE